MKKGKLEIALLGEENLKRKSFRISALNLDDIGFSQESALLFREKIKQSASLVGCRAEVTYLFLGSRTDGAFYLLSFIYPPEKEKKLRKYLTKYPNVIGIKIPF